LTAYLGGKCGKKASFLLEGLGGVDEASIGNEDLDTGQAEILVGLKIAIDRTRGLGIRETCDRTRWFGYTENFVKATLPIGGLATLPREF
jgi:hypothetical protein